MTYWEKDKLSQQFHLGSKQLHNHLIQAYKHLCSNLTVRELLCETFIQSCEHKHRISSFLLCDYEKLCADVWMEAFSSTARAAGTVQTKDRVPGSWGN